MLLGYFGGDDNDVAFLGGMGQGFRDDSSLSLKNRDDEGCQILSKIT